MHCGRCGGTLEVLDEQGVEIDRCGGCGVIFFDAGELDRYVGAGVEAAHHRVLEEGVASEHACPRCGEALRIVQGPAGTLEACTGCAGVLLLQIPVSRRTRRTVRSDLLADAASDLLLHGPVAAVDVPDGILDAGGRLVGGLLEAIGEILS